MNKNISELIGKIRGESDTSSRVPMITREFYMIRRALDAVRENSETAKPLLNNVSVTNKKTMTPHYLTKKDVAFLFKSRQGRMRVGDLPLFLRACGVEPEEHLIYSATSAAATRKTQKYLSTDRLLDWMDTQNIPQALDADSNNGRLSPTPQLPMLNTTKAAREQRTMMSKKNAQSRAMMRRTSTMMQTKKHNDLMLTSTVNDFPYKKYSGSSRRKKKKSGPAVSGEQKDCEKMKSSVSASFADDFKRQTRFGTMRFHSTGMNTYRVRLDTQRPFNTYRKFERMNRKRMQSGEYTNRGSKWLSAPRGVINSMAGPYVSDTERRQKEQLKSKKDWLGGYFVVCDHKALVARREWKEKSNQSLGQEAFVDSWRRLRDYKNEKSKFLDKDFRCC